jgi:hypothetical protein
LFPNILMVYGGSAIGVSESGVIVSEWTSVREANDLGAPIRAA